MDIRNCDIKYKCPQNWNSLIVTSEENIRYCEHCDRGVHYCQNKEDLMAAMKKNQCVAIPLDPLYVQAEPSSTSTSEIDPFASLPMGIDDDEFIMGDIEWNEDFAKSLPNESSATEPSNDDPFALGGTPIDSSTDEPSKS